MSQVLVGFDVEYEQGPFVTVRVTLYVPKEE